MSNEIYYKLININTGEYCYAKCNLPVKIEKFCKFLGLKEYRAEVISKEEYYSEVGDDEE